MPELEIAIGGRSFAVACQPGQEDYLRAAAAMLDAEARPLMQQAGRLTETKLLLLAGLMLADRMAAFEDRLRIAEARVAELEARPATRVEVPVTPPAVAEALAEIAARAEALAEAAEERAARG